MANSHKQVAFNLLNYTVIGAAVVFVSRVVKKILP